MKVSAEDIAFYFVERSSGLPENDLTNLKLQKMLYYAQAEYMKANNGQVLFEDKIEAWKHGPVAPSVYNLFKKCGAYRISDFDIPGPRGKKEIPDNDTQEFLNKIFNKYIRFSAWALVDETHKEGSPWQRTYRDGIANIEIPNELLAAAPIP